MTLKLANNLLPHFKYLEGTPSKEYRAGIKLIFISFIDYNLVKSHYEWWKKSGSQFPTLPSDEGKFTLVAELSIDKIVDVKSLFQNEIPDDLIEYIEQLESLQNVFPTQIIGQ